MQQEEVIFEQQEVVWAKIRGYPWWPAFVSEIHQIQGAEMEYTVVFFGDNTNSRLDGSKLRKFIENYIECFSKAKSHRKLMNSIMMAEDNLKENDQNVEIFQQLRNKIKNKKVKPKGRENGEEGSLHSEQVELKNKERDNQNQIFQEAQQPEHAQNKQSQSNQKSSVKEKAVQKQGFKKYNKAAINAEESIQQQNEKEELQKEQQIQQKQQKVKVGKKKQKKQRQRSSRKKSIMREVDIAIQFDNRQWIVQKQPSKMQQQPQNIANPTIKQTQQSNQVVNQIIIQPINTSINQPLNQPIKQADNQIANLDSKKQTQTDVKKATNKEKRRGSDKKRNKVKQQPPIVFENTSQKQETNNQKAMIYQQKVQQPAQEIVLPLLQKHATQPIPSKQVKQIQMEIQQPQEIQDQEDPSSQVVVVKRRGRSVSTGHSGSNLNRPMVSHHRKRGRPKKIDKQLEEQQESQRQSRAQNQQNVQKKKFIRKPLPPIKQIQRPKGLSLADQAVINGVKKLLHNRSGLVQFLSHSIINVHNVKEILDMDVSNILQQGVVTEQVIHLLEMFRAALLYKYFPDDVKHRKKYERLSKKKNIEVRQQKEESSELPQIRKKTLLKIRKFLTGINEQQTRIKEISQKIEEGVYRSDQTLGEHYKKIAFQVLSGLKQKKQSFPQILRKVEGRFYD